MEICKSQFFTTLYVSRHQNVILFSLQSFHVLINFNTRLLTLITSLWVLSNFSLFSLYHLRQTVRHLLLLILGTRLACHLTFFILLLTKPKQALKTKNLSVIIYVKMIVYLQQNQMISVPTRASNIRECLLYIFHYSNSI